MPVKRAKARTRVFIRDVEASVAGGGTDGAVSHRAERIIGDGAFEESSE